jgi:tripartite-type tricarboxylate transporter receptor subunit TctC
MVNIPPSIAHIRSGKLKALAVTSATRELLLPEVPTLAEAGVPGYDVEVWVGMFAPAGTPKDVVARLQSAIARSLDAPEVREKLIASGIVPASSTPQVLSETIRRELALFGKMVKAGQINAK